MNVRFTSRSLHQIEDILSFIYSNSPQGAAKVAARLDEILELLKRQPHVGRRTDRAGIRRLTLSPYPYVLFYRVTGADTDIIVLRVLHASRRTAAGR